MPDERNEPQGSESASSGRPDHAASVPSARQDDPAGDAFVFEDAVVRVASSRASTYDPQACAAFALGWQMAELYRPPRGGRFKGQDDDDLPGLGSLNVEARIEILMDQIQAAISALRYPIEQAGLPAISLDKVRATIGQDRQVHRKAVRALHQQVLGSLTAADFRLGTSYGLGRALADTCRKPTDQHSLQAELSRYRIVNLLGWLDDLGSVFPDHTAHSVYASLERWCDWAQKLGETQQMPEDTIRALGRQGELWRALLSGEKRATEMLEPGNYLDAAHDLEKHMRSIVRSAIWRFPILSFGILVLLVSGIVLLVAGGTSQIIGGATSLIAAFGLTWKGLGSGVGRLTGKLEEPLWGTAIDGAIANAITLLPDNAQDHRGRRVLATQLPASQDQSDTRPPRPPAAEE